MLVYLAGNTMLHPSIHQWFTCGVMKWRNIITCDKKPPFIKIPSTSKKPAASGRYRCFIPTWSWEVTYTKSDTYLYLKGPWFCLAKVVKRKHLTWSSGGIQCSGSSCSRCQMETHRTKAFGCWCMYSSTFFDWTGAYEIGSNTKVESGLIREGAFEYFVWIYFFRDGNTEEKSVLFWYRHLSIRIVRHLQKVPRMFPWHWDVSFHMSIEMIQIQLFHNLPSCTRPKQLKKLCIWN